MDTRFYHEDAGRINAWGVTLKTCGIISIIIGGCGTFSSFIMDGAVGGFIAALAGGIVITALGALFKGMAEVTELASRQLDAMQPKKEEEKTE